MNSNQEKQFESLRDFIKNNPEKIDEILKECRNYDYEGPTIREYFTQLNESEYTYCIKQLNFILNGPFAPTKLTLPQLVDVCMQLKQKYDLLLQKYPADLENLPAQKVMRITDMPADQKQQYIERFSTLVAQQALHMFMFLGLETHFYTTIINQPTNEKFLLTFKKIEE